MNDWIEKLRERPEKMNSMKFALENEDPRAAMIRAELWPLLCDVVEAAEASTIPFGVAMRGMGFSTKDPEFTEWRALGHALVALKAEVEK